MKSTEFLSQPTAPRSRFQRHPLVKDLPTLPKDSADYGRIRASIASDGIREPLKCVLEGNAILVLDGLHRLGIAEELEIADLPYQVLDEKDLLAFVCASVVRAGWNKSALAYRMWPLFAAAACYHGGQRKGDLRKGSKGNDFPLIAAAEIATLIGVSEKLVDQAKSAHAFFSKHPDRKEELEPLILMSLLPLHRVKESHGNRQQAPAPSFVSIESLFKRMPEPFRDWERMGFEEQQRASNLFAEAVRKLPKEVQIAALETLEVAWRP